MEIKNYKQTLVSGTFYNIPLHFRDPINLLGDRLFLSVVPHLSYKS